MSASEPTVGIPLPRLYEWNRPYFQAALAGRLMLQKCRACGALIYYDEAGRPCGHDDVHTKIELCRKHFAAVGLGEDYVDQFIR